MAKKVEYSYAPAGEFVIAPTTSTSSSTTTVLTSPHHGRSRRHVSGEDALEAAVFSHIKAIRTLGRTELNTEDIARALAVPVTQVNAVIAKLRGKGVKVAA